MIGALRRKGTCGSLALGRIQLGGDLLMVIKSDQVAPVLKWVGGKRQLLGALAPLIPKRFTHYCEPFFGGGAVLFALQPNKAIVNDLNHELIGVYEVIRDHVDELIALLKTHENSPEYFYELRNLDRDPKSYLSLSKVERASRIIYLNKTCFNGLFRVNRQGEFNAPFGHYKHPNIVNEPVVRAVSRFFNSCNVTFYSEDFSSVLRRLDKGTFVYLDPPYDPLSDSSNFTGYSSGGFSRADQLRLKECCDELSAKGIKFMLSNSSTDFIRELYSDYNITAVDARRNINVKGDRRGPVRELVVRNYHTRKNRIPLMLVPSTLCEAPKAKTPAQVARSAELTARAQAQLNPGLTPQATPEVAPAPTTALVAPASSTPAVPATPVVVTAPAPTQPTTQTVVSSEHFGPKTAPMPDSPANVQLTEQVTHVMIDQVTGQAIKQAAPAPELEEQLTTVVPVPPHSEPAAVAEP